jgi:hypothetical protein
MWVKIGNFFSYRLGPSLNRSRDSKKRMRQHLIKPVYRRFTRISGRIGWSLLGLITDTIPTAFLQAGHGDLFHPTERNSRLHPVPPPISHVGILGCGTASERGGFTVPEPSPQRVLGGDGLCQRPDSLIFRIIKSDLL